MKINDKTRSWLEIIQVICDAVAKVLEKILEPKDLS